MLWWLFVCADFEICAACGVETFLLEETPRTGHAIDGSFQTQAVNNGAWCMGERNVLTKRVLVARG